MQAFDQQGESAGRAQFPVLRKVNPFCRAVETGAGTQSKEAGELPSVERRCACLVFQKLQGLFTGCPSSGPPHFPTSVRALRSGAQRGTHWPHSGLGLRQSRWLKCGGVPPGALLLRTPMALQRGGGRALAPGHPGLGPRPSGQRSPGSERGPLSALCGKGPGTKAPLSVGLG